MWPFSAASSEAESSTSAAAAPATAVLSAAPAYPAPVERSAEETAAQAKSRWERTVEDEQKYQDKVYPTTDELPSCMSLM